RVKLRGTKSNRDGIGATVRVTAGGRTQSGYVKSGSSYESASELTLTFGFGPGVARVDAIDVVWPSGASQQIKDVPTGRAIVVDETAGIVP
ncbi:MAG TPA: ASPIC/UnbV domain-containing protein, partial [Verrucomicrobiae bacterium]|nr:ASPIC/UnbV domain-containing protein [Verrucomicrobiae bacterium]